MALGSVRFTLTTSGEERALALPPFSDGWTTAMVIKRRRFKQTHSLEERLAQDTAKLRKQANKLPPGPAQEDIERRIRQNEAATDFCEMLRSPGPDATV